MAARRPTAAHRTTPHTPPHPHACFFILDITTTFCPSPAPVPRACFRCMPWPAICCPAAATALPPADRLPPQFACAHYHYANLLPAALTLSPIYLADHARRSRTRHDIYSACYYLHCRTPLPYVTFSRLPVCCPRMPTVDFLTYARTRAYCAENTRAINLPAAATSLPRQCDTFIMRYLPPYCFATSAFWDTYRLHLPPPHAPHYAPYTRAPLRSDNTTPHTEPAAHTLLPRCRRQWRQ